MKNLLVYVVSGGPDSIFAWFFVSSLLRGGKEMFNDLLYIHRNKIESFIKIFDKTEIKQIIFHYNHKVRQESDQEAEFLKEFFQKQKFEIIIGENKNLKLKTEAELRQARWEWIKNQIEKLKFEYDKIFIITGHNLTDRIETTFLNMLRGTHFEGFLNMRFLDRFFLLPDKEVFIVRPLLDLPKDYIQKLCEKFDIPYFIDKTNFDFQVSKRNKIRQIIFELVLMANKRKNGTNMFLKSWQNIYDKMEESKKLFLDNNGGIFLEDVYKEFWNKLGVNFIKKIHFNKRLGELSIDDIIQLFKKLGIYKDITNKNLLEFVRFFKLSKSGRKKFKGLVFCKTSGGFFIMDKKPFEGFLGKILEKKKDYIIRYPRRGDKFKNKLLTKYLAKELVPIFLRGWIKVKERDGKIKDVLLPN